MRQTKPDGEAPAGAEDAGVAMVYTTLANNDAARRFAATLLEERLIACANILPIWSLYNWRGELKDESEVAVLLKTAAVRVPDLMRRIPQIHPYEVPCIEVFPVQAVHPAFGAWIDEETRMPAPTATAQGD